MARPWDKAQEKKVAKPVAEVAETVVKVEEPVVVEKVVPPAEKAEPMVLVSDRDAHIYDRMKSQPKNLDDIKVHDLRMDTDGIPSILELPKYFKALEAKYTFVWVSKNPRSVDDYLDNMEFNLVNRVLFPDAPKYLFTANGSVERGDLILMFMSKEKAERLRQRPGELSRERVRGTLVQDLSKWKDMGDERFYKPDSGVAENDNDEEPRGRYVQPDAAPEGEQA